MNQIFNQVQESSLTDTISVVYWHCCKKSTCCFRHIILLQIPYPMYVCVCNGNKEHEISNILLSSHPSVIPVIPIGRMSFNNLFTNSPVEHRQVWAALSGKRVYPDPVQAYSRRQSIVILIGRLEAATPAATRKIESSPTHNERTNKRDSEVFQVVIRWTR